MQHTESSHGIDPHPASPIPPDYEPIELDPADFEPRPFSVPSRRRMLLVIAILVTLLLAAVLPPLINVNRFQRSIARSISRSLGRPVHLGSVTLNLLPIPSFTLQNFVVSEDPGFGSEPVIHAASVTARLRFRSLWRGHVEFSRISLTDPSVNLVRRADGRWNIESILLQASRIEAAPTTPSSAQPGIQPASGFVPRFPYIEATNARVNLKMGLEKMPIALTEADFALWLPQPQQWRLRFLGHPARTDTSANDTGAIRLQGTLGKAGSLSDVPVDLTAEWSGAPLGAVSWVTLGRDAGFRGDMTLLAAISGTVGSSSLHTHLQLRGARRSEFVPVRSLDADLTCDAHTSDGFHRLANLQCLLPTGGPRGGVAITGDIADLLHPASALLRINARDVDSARLLDALRLASPRVSPDLRLTGQLFGSATLQPLEGSFTGSATRLALGNAPPFFSGELAAQLSPDDLELAPIELDLGGDATLSGSANRSGYTMHLSGTLLRSRLLALASALPQFGDGLLDALPNLSQATAASPETSTASPQTPTVSPETPIAVDLVSIRAWSGGQSWTPVAPRAIAPRHHRRVR